MQDERGSRSVNAAQIHLGAIYRYYPKHLREDPSCGACRAVNGGVVRVPNELPLMPTGFDHSRPLTEPWVSMRRFRAYQVEAGPEGGKVSRFRSTDVAPSRSSP